MDVICEQIKKNGEKCKYLAKWKVKLNDDQDYNLSLCGIHSRKKDRIKLIVDNTNLEKKEKNSNDNTDKIEMIMEDNEILFKNGDNFDQLDYEVIKSSGTYILKCNKKSFDVKLYINTPFKINNGTYNKYKGKTDNYIVLKNKYYFEFIEDIEKKLQENIKKNKILDSTKFDFSSTIKYNNKNNDKYIVLPINNNYVKVKEYEKGILHIKFNKLWIKNNKFGLSCNVTNIFKKKIKYMT